MWEVGWEEGSTCLPPFPEIQRCQWLSTVGTAKAQAAPEACGGWTWTGRPPERARPGSEAGGGVAKAGGSPRGGVPSWARAGGPLVLSPRSQARSAPRYRGVAWSHGVQSRGKDFLSSSPAFGGGRLLPPPPDRGREFHRFVTARGGYGLGSSSPPLALGLLLRGRRRLSRQAKSAGSAFAAVCEERGRSGLSS